MYFESTGTVQDNATSRRTQTPAIVFFQYKMIIIKFDWFSYMKTNSTQHVMMSVLVSAHLEVKVVLSE